MTNEEQIKQAARSYAELEIEIEAGYVLTARNAFIAGANFGRELGMKEAFEWKDVDNRLPYDGMVLLAMWEASKPEHTEIKVLGYSAELGFITTDENGDCDENVTHWRPINFEDFIKLQK